MSPGAAASVAAAAGRADLFRALDRDGEAGLGAMCDLLGYEERPDAGDERYAPEATAAAAAVAGEAPEEAAGADFLPVPFWRPVAAELSPEEEISRLLAPPVERRVGEPKASDFDPPEEGRRRLPAPIAGWPRLWRVLDDRLRTTTPRREIDVGELVARWARGENVEPLPRLQGLVHSRVAIVLDHSPPLLPFRFDQLQVAGELMRRLGAVSARVVAVRGGEAAPPAAAKDERVLALTDLGAYGRGRRAAFWEGFGERLRRSGVAALALVPAPPERWPRRAAELWSAREWSAPARAPARAVRAVDRAPAAGAEAVETLLRLASPAVRLEAGLVRDLRRLVPGAGVDVEVETWRHGAVAARSRRGLRLDPDEARRRLGLFRELPEALQRSAVEALIDWHQDLAPEVWAEEVIGLLAHGVPETWIGAERVERAIGIFAKLCLLVEGRRGTEAELLAAGEAFHLRFAGRASRPVWAYGPLRPFFARAARALRERLGEAEPAAGGTPEMFIPSDEELERWVLWQEGSDLSVRAAGEAGEGSLLAAVSTRGGELLAGDGVEAVRGLDLAGEPPRFRWPGGGRPVEVVSDVEALRFELWRPPEWASAAGRDEHGLWAAFEIGGVEQRMRWIPPGRFRVGSPESEAGRWDDEGPRHWVVLTEGFWLAETPCTQALWEAVTGEGENPSRFKSPERPVEQVSWDECQEFLDRLNFRIRGLEVWLPTEAEWEYACRAGMETATWVGDLEIVGERNAPLLDDIAWYGGNSGVGLEPGVGIDSSGWKEKQHPHSRAATREVGLKRPNPWGLYDMLGNVFEWCWDLKGSYEPRVALDPEGPGEGAERVIRGGSWLAHARSVRAAFRGWGPPGDRYPYLGFRLSRGQGRGAQASEEMGEGSGRARRGTSPRRRSRRERAWVERLGWAADGGADRFGRWASFRVGGVTQRMRWIVPGRFLMGSPAAEAGRFDREGPRHEVTLSEGFWLGETPCTQELWQAVMGDNPSYFPSPRRPVEQVSWEDCRRFFERLNATIPELRAGFPAEAQWEYACRAGTRTATWAGDLRILGERNAPRLDKIAWYGGNSGVGYELQKGWDSSDWRETQYPHTRAGTREVGGKEPNPWGLYDMLGNVYEWCSDWWADQYPEGPRVDPSGPDEGAERVIRGGSWVGHARLVRAAYRYCSSPGFRLHYLGFRLSRGQGPRGKAAEPQSEIKRAAEPEGKLKEAWRKLRGRPPRDEA